jgi:hypothetical protein
VNSWSLRLLAVRLRLDWTRDNSEGDRASSPGVSAGAGRLSSAIADLLRRVNGQMGIVMFSIKIVYVRAMSERRFSSRDVGGVCELRFRAEFEETYFTANYRDVCQLVMQGAELWLVCFAGETWHATVLMSAGRETLT